MKSIALVTDSSSQISSDLADRFGARVVPLTVSIDGAEYLEGSELDADAFYRMVESAPDPLVLSTTQPTPDQFVAAFEDAASAGSAEVLAVLVGSAYSGTVNAATLAAAAVDIPVRIVDSGVASFGITSCLWAAAEVLAADGSVDDAVAAAETRASAVESVFILQGIELARQSGRFAAVESDIQEEEIAIIWSGRSGMEVIDSVRTVDAAVAVMIGRLVAGDQRLVAAVGRAGRQTEPVTDAFRAALEGTPRIAEIVEYRVGPSIAAHTGPGTAGGFYWPTV